MPPFDSAIEPGWGWLMEFGRERSLAMTVSARSGLAELRNLLVAASKVITALPGTFAVGSVADRSALAERAIGGVA